MNFFPFSLLTLQTKLLCKISGFNIPQFGLNVNESVAKKSEILFLYLLVTKYHLDLNQTDLVSTYPSDQPPAWYRSWIYHHVSSTRRAAGPEGSCQWRRAAARPLSPPRGRCWCRGSWPWTDPGARTPTFGCLELEIKKKEIQVVWLRKWRVSSNSYVVSGKLYH